MDVADRGSRVFPKISAAAARKGACFALVVTMGALVCVCIPWPLSAGQEVVVRVRVESQPPAPRNLQAERNGSGSTADEAELEPERAQTASAATEASLPHDAHTAEVSSGITNTPRDTRTPLVKQPPPLPPTMLRTTASRLEPSVRTHQTPSPIAPAGGTVETFISSHTAAASTHSLKPAYPVDDLQQVRDQQYGQTPDFDPDLFQ